MGWLCSSPGGPGPASPPRRYASKSRGERQSQRAGRGTCKCFSPIDMTCLLRGAKLFCSKTPGCSQCGGCPSAVGPGLVRAVGAAHGQGARTGPGLAGCRLAGQPHSETESGPGEVEGTSSACEVPAQPMGLVGTFGCSGRTPSLALAQVPASPKEASVAPPPGGVHPTTVQLWCVLVVSWGVRGHCRGARPLPRAAPVPSSLETNIQPDRAPVLHPPRATLHPLPRVAGRPSPWFGVTSCPP